MINLIRTLFPDKSLQVNQTPLQFTPLAIERIEQQINQRPKSVQSCFQISLSHKERGVVYRVGFIERPQSLTTLYSYPVTVQIKPEDERYLLGSYLDYHSEEESFYIYPDIKIEVEDTPDANILRFVINRYLIATDSPQPEIAFDRKSYPQLSLFQKLFILEDVCSIYLKKNWLQVEFIPDKRQDNSEQKLAEILLKYFERSNYPFSVTNHGLKQKKFKTD